MCYIVNFCNYCKIVVFDQYIVIIGGYNFVCEYMGFVFYWKCFCDFGVVISGFGVVLFNEVFFVDWVFVSNQLIDMFYCEIMFDVICVEGESVMQIVVSGFDVKGDLFYEGIFFMIQEVWIDIFIVMFYFIFDEVFWCLFMVKVCFGIEVMLILFVCLNYLIIDFVWCYYMCEFCKVGVKVFFYGLVMMYVKVVMVDYCFGFIGFVNFDFCSFFVNFEIGVFFYIESDIFVMCVWVNDFFVYCCELKFDCKCCCIFIGIVEDFSCFFVLLF